MESTADQEFEIISSRTIRPHRIPDFIALSRKERAAFFERYVRWIPRGIAQLQQRVRSTAGFELWQPTAEPEQLLLLGRWLKSTVATEVVDVEMENVTIRDLETDLPIKSGYTYRGTSTVLTEKSSRIAVEFATFYAELMRAEYPELEWRLQTRKSSWSEGQPVLVKPTTFPKGPEICTPLVFGDATLTHMALGHCDEGVVADHWKKRSWAMRD